MDPTATVTVRMYHVGFGDAFLVTVRSEAGAWRMLIDCGAHSQGQARPMAEVVRAIVADLTEAAAAGDPPRLDVLVATHRHADHISGFAVDAWEAVEVGEVWVPFIHDETDPDGIALSRAQARAAMQLRELI
ncbi:MAG: MBL fold metallo-hydrolase, partial [Candidatus Nanopelagicales bacterium]